MQVELKRVKLTDRFVKSATTGGRKSPIFMDDEVIGFGLQVRETGRKSFTLDYMFARASAPNFCMLIENPNLMVLTARRCVERKHGYFAICCDKEIKAT
jgi:hypothetical protein